MIWLITGLAIFGTILNIRKNRWCFRVWLVSNSALCIHNFIIGEYAQSGLFLVYVGLAIYGIWSWRKK